ncbi:MAG: sulfotransferase family protein [Actinomycetes bacterium]
MLPNLLVIGAAKAGTTSLWAYLDAHPDVFMAPDKELHFFDLDSNWSRGVDWYAGHFDGSDGYAIVGEATPAYARYPHRPNAAERAAAVVPDARLIYLVRDPVERARSHVVHEMRHGRERLDLAAALSANPMYLDTSRYAMQLRQWLAHYRREAVLVVESERLRSDPETTLRSIYRFLCVEELVLPDTIVVNESAQALRSSPRSQRLRTRSGVRTLAAVTPRTLRAGLKDRIRKREHARALGAAISPELRAQLLEQLRPDIEALAALLPPTFTGWGLLGEQRTATTGAFVSGGAVRGSSLSSEEAS